MRHKIILSILFVSGVLLTSLFNETNAQAFQIAQDEECGKLEEIPGDIRTKVPWVAAIFGRAGPRSPYKFSVIGTLIGPTTVLTLFGGAYGVASSSSAKYFIPRAEDYLVALGLNSNNLDETDIFTQKAQVSHIQPWKMQDDQKYYNYFIFHLKYPVNLNTPYVKAACVPVFSKVIKSVSSYGRIGTIRQGGFGYPPRRTDGIKELVIMNITLGTEQQLTKEQCVAAHNQNYDIAPDDSYYCSSIIQSGNYNPICVEPGSGAAMPLYADRWFIVAIAALIPNSGSKAWCNSKTLYFYGRVVKSIDWILTNYKCSPQFACSDSTCIPVSKLCDQKPDCPGGEDEDPIYCRATNPCIFGDKTYECGVYGKCISPKQICDGTRDCEDGSDERNRNCPSRKSDPIPMRNSQNQNSPLPGVSLNTRNRATTPSHAHCVPFQISEGVEIDCQFQNGQYINCSSSAVDTIATLRCKKYYRSNSRTSTLSLTCQEDRTWKPNRGFSCDAECGVISNGISPYIFGGDDTSRENAFPWHSAIFKLIKNQYQFICGGSLLERTVLITAGHCVSDSTGAAVNKSQFKIVLGGNSSTYEKAVENRYSQVFNAANIFIPATYDRRSLQSDIAIIELDKPAIYGESVRPVCFLEKGFNSIPDPGTLGKVPGYGFRENHKISEKLLYAVFPVVSADECKKALGRTPPLSTFCAGYRNGTSVCQGDSGSSMVFPVTTGSVTKYFVKGIVSHGEVKQGRKCDPYNYAVFTHVDAFADWILQRLQTIVV